MRKIAVICLLGVLAGCRTSDLQTLLVGEWQSDTVATFFGNARFDCHFQRNGVVTLTRHYDPPYGEGTMTSSYTITGEDTVAAPLEKNRDFIFKRRGDTLELAVTVPNPATSNIVEYVWRFRKTGSSQQTDGAATSEPAPSAGPEAAHP